MNYTGKDIGRYHLLDPLGEGGMATVYKAYDTHLERDVAIKIIRRDAFSPETLDRVLKRFEREAKTLARLTHPNIVSIIDYGEIEGSPYLVMPYLPGGTLKQQMGQPIPYQIVVQLLSPVADALGYAHQMGVIHRDVKPSNILITATGQPMLSDFGIARLLEAEGGHTITGTGVGVGTPEYMSPEQGLGNEVDGRADIYALGVVFYEMITGRKPYMADTPMAVVLKQMTEPLPRPKLLAPDLPDRVEQLLFKAMAKSREDRYASMADLKHAMDLLLIESGKTESRDLPIPREAVSAPPEVWGNTQTGGETVDLAPKVEKEDPGWETRDVVEPPAATPPEEPKRSAPPPPELLGKTQPALETVIPSLKVVKEDPGWETRDDMAQPPPVPPSRQDGFGQWPGVPPVMPKNTLPRPPIQVPPALPPQRFPGKAPKNNNKVWIIVVCAVIGACLLGFLLLVSSGLLSTPATEAPTAAPVVYNTAVPVMVDHTVKVPIMADAEAGNEDCSDWGTCRNAQTGNFTILTGYENGTISADLDTSGYFIRRMFLYFDTSAIPADAEITSATLSFYAGPFQEGNTIVHVVHSNADYPFTPESYGKAENLTGGGVELKPDQWFSIPLNSDGLNWIQKGSITKLALMHDYDLSNVVPNSGNSVVITRAGAAQNTPYLEISYRSSN